MRRTKIVMLLTALIAVISGPDLRAQNTREIIQKSLDMVQGQSSSATLRMQIVRPNWTRDLTLKSWSLGTDYGLILITDPSRDKGTAFLKRGNELWNWQPRIERSIKMPPSMMLQSWMGSDFTNDDLVRQSSIVDDYSHRLLREEMFDGRACYVIELVPNAGAAVVWGKIITWITKTSYMTLKNEFYDEDEILVNTMIGTRISRMDDREIPTVLEVIPADEEGNRTIITYLALDFDIAIDETFFSVQNMKAVE
ncbi:MAG TPA: outer membrane lipoprotein-sorting protein [Saprospiraceae bacterium]|nr:outer membrane lipoprotein-sorting protein [Saprospiraceae bacterium]